MPRGKRSIQEIRQRKPVVDRKLCRKCGFEKDIESFSMEGCIVNYV